MDRARTGLGIVSILASVTSGLPPRASSGGGTPRSRPYCGAAAPARVAAGDRGVRSHLPRPDPDAGLVTGGRRRGPDRRVPPAGPGHGTRRDDRQPGTESTRRRLLASPPSPRTPAAGCCSSPPSPPTRRAPSSSAASSTPSPGSPSGTCSSPIRTRSCSSPAKPTPAPLSVCDLLPARRMLADATRTAQRMPVTKLRG